MRRAGVNLNSGKGSMSSDRSNNIVDDRFHFTSVFIGCNDAVVAACRGDVIIISSARNEYAGLKPLVTTGSLITKKRVAVLKNSLWRRKGIDGNVVVERKRISADIVRNDK